MDDAAIVAAFAEHQARRNLADNTITKYASTLRGLKATLNGQGLRGATRDDVEAFLATRNIGPRGRHHYISHLACFYQWALDEGHVRADPTRKCERPRLPELTPRPITDADLALALKAGGPRMRAWLTLGAYAGLRCKEIAGVQVADLRLSEPAVLVVSAPKGRRERAVPVHPQVEKAFCDYGLPASGYVFRSRDSGGPLAPESVSESIARHLHRHGVDATAHQLRHWFGTTMYRLTKDLHLVQRLMGHSDPKSTIGYTKLAPHEAAEAVSLLPSIAAGG